jgi:hypothetical protein
MGAKFRGAIGVTLVGLVIAIGAYIWNAQPLPADDGANIGAGLLELLGIVIGLVGLMMLAVAAFVSGRNRRRRYVALPPFNQ